MFVLNILYQVFFVSVQQQGDGEKELAENAGHKLYKDNAGVHS